MAAVTVGKLLGLPAPAEHTLVTHILKIKSPAFSTKKFKEFFILFLFFIFFWCIFLQRLLRRRPSSQREVSIPPERRIFQFLGDYFDLP
jgi:hypothetical protein